MYPSLTCQRVPTWKPVVVQKHPNHQGQNSSQSPSKHQVPSAASSPSWWSVSRGKFHVSQDSQVWLRDELSLGCTVCFHQRCQEPRGLPRTGSSFRQLANFTLCCLFLHETDDKTCECFWITFFLEMDFLHWKFSSYSSPMTLAGTQIPPFKSQWGAQAPLTFGET